MEQTVFYEEPMSFQEELLSLIITQPGTTVRVLSERFALSEYRLNRAFRHLERDLSGQVIVKHPVHGVWLVRMDGNRCHGVEWKGGDSGGYGQCELQPAFPDGRCYEHTTWEDPEMVAFLRRLTSMLGPCDASLRYVVQLTLNEVEELHGTLQRIIPLTRQDRVERERLLGVLGRGLAWLRWKAYMRRMRVEARMHPEFARRHRASSINPFEFVLNKLFALLEIPTTSEREEVLKAWKQLSMRYHPDRPDGDEERMKAINTAKDKIFRIRRWD